MTEIAFGRLEDLPLRAAWPDEARDFTPWLAANIDHLADIIGVPLEVTDTEAPVGPFSADILARNPQDDTVVLIENQLERTDHTHLGQIMTYLAGLDAQTVVWIAPSFREPHLSGIHWLNEHTADGFSFFAVRLRVVRIGDSPYAPIFEVVAKPDYWERRIAASVQKSAGDSAVGDQRQAYWRAYAARHPGAMTAASRQHNFASSPDDRPDITVVTWVGRKEGGIFVRGAYGEDRSMVVARLAPLAERLEADLGAPLGDGKAPFEQAHPGSLDDPATWPALIDWQEAQRRRYLAAFNALAPEMTQ